ncbi:MBL fold metallo-hydrolase [Cuneatibacter caecimuris]|uniref:Phosphoribosyl 1,2-cyclic phosphodiesterase n=1 Tax=Cuneatibacter caecimuris TaxID=1796618 RepID=A0A4Q7PM65_9FIRM|nr:MBL fold metallo-hydrolase [Cuneatibacter caecimuris]RZT01999.1 phosphoribosyl 1,2-cyclic phosphodiesterase [Cuneatibacter caecimuris]
MRFVSLASGSSGNCTYIGTDRTHILIDAGISCRRIEQGVESLDVKASELDGIFITHEHSDHICGLKILCKRYGVPVYGTERTLERIRESDKKGEIDPELYHPLEADCSLKLGGLEVIPFQNYHDAADPVAYRVETEEDGRKKSAAVITDLGHYTDYTVDHLKNLDGILIEANHDIRMLESGSYPYSLKRRILGDLGHLSNERSGQLLTELLHDGLKQVLLGHLSKENNYEELAYETVRLEITMGDNPYQAGDFDIRVARRDMPSETILL